MTNMEIREAAEEDAGEIARLALELLDELNSQSPSGYETSALSSRARTLLRLQAITALLAIKDGTAIGLAVLNPCASLYAGYFGEITELYVKPEFRSGGTGASLIDAAVAIARSRSWSRLEVGTPELPLWARTAAFYMRNGFIEVGARLKLPVTT